jgi:hypothetical protein
LRVEIVKQRSASCATVGETIARLRSVAPTTEGSVFFCMGFLLV